MSDHSIGPWSLMHTLAVNGLVPVHHQAGLPSSWIETMMEDGTRRSTPNYNPRIHDLQIPVSFFQVRTHANGRRLLCYNPYYDKPERPDLQANPDVWYVVKCEGGIAVLTIDLAKPLEEPCKVTVTCREAPVEIPAGQTRVTVTLQGCSDAINASKAVTITSINSEDIVDLSIFTLSVEVKEIGRLVTGLKNAVFQWCN